MGCNEVARQIDEPGVATGCRDGRTCVAPGAAKANRAMLAGLLHLARGISFVVSRVFMSHCRQCRHLLDRHRRRADGSFRD